MWLHVALVALGGRPGHVFQAKAKDWHPCSAEPHLERSGIYSEVFKCAKCAVFQLNLTVGFYIARGWHVGVCAGSALEEQR